MNSNQNLAKIPSAKSFAERIIKIGLDLLQVAQDLVQAIDAKPELLAELNDEGVNMELVRRLEMLGRNQIHSSLVFATSNAAIKLIACPLSLQTQAVKNGIEVLEADGTSRIIALAELSRKQTEQIFAKGKIRSLAEQRTWLNEHQKLPSAITVENDFKVHKDHVVITKPMKVPRTMLLRWLTEMN